MPYFDARNLRPYRGAADLPAVLAFVGECNARADGCGYLHPGDIVHNMSNALRGRDLDRHFHLYEEAGGRLVALVVAYAVREAAFDVLVHPDRRGGDLERALLAEGERLERALLRDAGAAAPAIGSEAMDCDGTRSEMLVGLGYAPAAGPSMRCTTRSLTDPFPEAPLPDGFAIRAVAGEHEVDAVCAVHDGSFTPKWSHEGYLAVMRTPGFDIDRELVVVAPDGRFAAFLIYWLDPVSRSGLLEPVGCHRDFQRRGLTKALMVEGMRRMHTGGMRSAIVNHHADNAAGAALYRSVGFRTRYAITEFHKPLE